MRFSKLVFSLIAFCLTAASFAVPKVLIIQLRLDPKAAASPVRLADALAQALEEEGKLDPIVWSQADPVFRDAVLDGRVSGTEKPAPNDVEQAQKALGCEYVVFTQVQIKGTALQGHVDMYRGVKQIWTDEESFDSGRSSEMDLDNAVRSVARTWAIRMGSGPLKALKAERRPPQTPGPSQGQGPKTSSDPVPRITDSSKAIAEYERLMNAKQVAEATNILRQAVDESPLDGKLRVLLIRHLAQIGRQREAAEEASRATVLLPENAEIRGMAAQAYIDSGNSDQAEQQLNEALARNPEDPVTRGMLADICLNGLKAQAAIDHLDVALKNAPSKDLAYRRAVSNAVLGDVTAVQNDLAHADQLSTWARSEEDSYKFCMGILDRALDQSVGDLRSLNQRAAVKREDPNVATEIDAQLATLRARQMFVDGWSPPITHKKSQGILSLALKLLSQSLSELKAYLLDGSQDTLTDATIDLGESIKQLSSAREALAAEQGSQARDGSTTVYSYH